MAMLSSNEIEALMNAVQQGQLQPTAADEPDTAIAYDLTSQDRVIRGQLPTLDSINDQIANHLGMALGGRLRVRVAVASMPATLMKFSDFYSLLRPPATFVVLQLSRSHGQAVAVLPEDLVRALLAAALGDRSAKIEEVPPDTRKDLTAVERSVLSKLISVFCETLGRAWTPVLPLTPEVLRFETDPRLAAVAPPGDVAILNTFQFTLGENDGQASMQVGIPYASVEAVKKKLQSSPRSTAAADKKFAMALSRCLDEVPMELCAVLGRARMSLNTFLDLKVGDVIPLDSAESRPLPLQVQGMTKLHGTPNVSWGRMALTLQDGMAPSNDDTQSPTPETAPNPQRAG